MAHIGRGPLVIELFLVLIIMEPQTPEATGPSIKENPKSVQTIRSNRPSSTPPRTASSGTWWQH